MKKSIPSAKSKAVATLETIHAALALFQAGKLMEAEVICQQILIGAPNHFDALHLLGVLKSLAKDYESSLSLLDQAAALKPDNQEVQKNRRISVSQYQAVRIGEAIALHQQGRFAEAEPIYLAVLELDTEQVDALQLIGALEAQRKNHQSAIDYLDRALTIKPDYAEAYNNRGTALQELKRLEEALASYDQALRIKPDYAEAYSNRGNALRELKRLEESLASHDQALRIKPDYAEAYSNRGNALQELKRLDEALANYDQALRIKPNYAEAYSNRGNALRELKRLDEALASYDQALRIKPNYAEAHWNESLCRLLKGEFEAGWQKYEWRWLRRDRTELPRSYPQPLWLGKEDLAGKTVLLYGEQGFGDTLQFSRYVRHVAALGAEIVLEVPGALLPLFSELEGKPTLVTKRSSLPAFDFHCPLMSLPLAFKTGLADIDGAPHLRVPEDRLTAWKTRISAAGTPRVGLVWSGSAVHKNDSNRSISLGEFKHLLVNGPAFFCLQKEIRESDQIALKSLPMVRTFASDLTDFADTAALVSLMDVVITVDTSVAHLAGALGKKVWILLPYVPDWRWLLDRSDSPWYDSATLFRQPKIGDWASVIDTVRQRLQDRAI